jgi:hypothetical protein
MRNKANVIYITGLYYKFIYLILGFEFPDLQVRTLIIALYLHYLCQYGTVPKEEYERAQYTAFLYNPARA